MSRHDERRRSVPPFSPRAGLRAAVALAPAAALVWAGVALGAHLGVISSTLGAGGAAVAPCDDSFTHSFTTSRGNVTAVTVGGIADPACDGGRVRVTITNASGASIASGGPETVVADGDSLDGVVTLAMSPQPAASLVAGIDIVIEGG